MLFCRCWVYRYYQYCQFNGSNSVFQFIMHVLCWHLFIDLTDVSLKIAGSWKFLEPKNSSSKFSDFRKSAGDSVIELASTPTKITGVHYVQVRWFWIIWREFTLHYIFYSWSEDIIWWLMMRNSSRNFSWVLIDWLFYGIWFSSILFICLPYLFCSSVVRTTIFI